MVKMALMMETATRLNPCRAARILHENKYLLLSMIVKYKTLHSSKPFTFTDKET